MAAHVEYSNFSSGYAWAKCSDCGWRGTKHIGAGKLSNDQARKEAAAHDAEHAAKEAAPAATYKLVGENTLTGNTWDCETGIATLGEALALRAGWTRLESDYKIEYRVEEEAPEADGEECEHGLSAWLCAGPMHYPADRESFF
ncbi:hypothetical protein PQE18_gp56 [Arthrobacter phage DrSierra]|uniref:Uncharacterized protein n=1 Tax=Arthrobacter phage DrSierra TaxID=2704034 RepID=A0A6G6XKJ1_9CAUD|nr:hypothetical protein PQE18_gp56 [Arthrobacter phage DrSierra]QIG58534.1 hypothetical protein SEA_DRSIERRA_56 [Arthrobacter phage DrSierra]